MSHISIDDNDCDWASTLTRCSPRVLYFLGHERVNKFQAVGVGGGGGSWESGEGDLRSAQNLMMNVTTCLEGWGGGWVGGWVGRS